MKSKPLVSIVLPNYNNAPYLKEAIDSILAQTYTHFEFIIVDDCSSDNSLDIINTYDDPRIVLIKKEANSGIVDSLNLGIDVATGEFMLRMDGDDISASDRLEKLLNFMHENPEIGVCSSAIQNFGLVDDLWTFEKDPLMNKAIMIFGHGIGHASSIFRMELFKDGKIRYRNEYPYVEDYKLFSELNEITFFSSISEYLYYYRRLDHSSTIFNEKTLRGRIGLIHKEYLTKFFDREPNEEELEIHYDIYRGEYRHPLKKYFIWINLLVSVNKINEIYPHIEFVKITNNFMDRLSFKALDKSIYTIFPIIYFQKKIKIKFLKYIIGSMNKSK